ncbi:hypothetical protein LPTSP3_g10340 [Leptospira kobayashii]|uniref:Uncharacterized protein n=1 Tax=Leptospira kobayashii TaxID=1917830 RepID=A0ABN6KEF5_9LEPT|nr:hypothetical protein [Leptospira kobayashii]BDA78104.1 hypothetical protein LPTSP3_g10340 [Leptospira kobayashii]
MSLLDQLAFPILFIWFIGLLLSLFRKDLETHWKFFFFLVFCFYMVQFFPEFWAGVARWKESPKRELLSWLGSMGQAIYVFLFLLWPLVLIRIYYSASNNLSKTLIPVLSYGTVVYWALFFMWTYYTKEWYKFIEDYIMSK